MTRRGDKRARELDHLLHRRGVPADRPAHPPAQRSRRFSPAPGRALPAAGRAELHKALSKALAGLSADYRTAIVLPDVEPCQAGNLAARTSIGLISGGQASGSFASQLLPIAGDLLRPAAEALAERPSLRHGSPASPPLRDTLQQALDDRKAVRVPAEDHELQDEGEAWPSLRPRERDAILQPPPPEIPASQRLPEHAMGWEAEPHPEPGKPQPAAGHTEVTAMDRQQERTWLDVPFERNKDARALGARWDRRRAAGMHPGPA